jgi:carbonic anhydrase
MSGNLIGVTPERARENLKPCCLAKALALKCLDYRFVDDTTLALEKEFGHTFDVVALAGAELFIVGDKIKEHFQKTLIESIELAIELHRVPLFIAVTHEGCGAYQKVFGKLSPKEEREVHIEHLYRMQEFMEENFPELKFRAYFQKFSGLLERII